MAMFSERVRENLFWSMDAVKGGSIKKHYAEIKSVIENNSSSNEEIKNKKLQALFEHAASTTSFYKQYNGKLNLQDFPVLNKTNIRNELDKFISSAFSKDALIPTVTSGSTGTPFKIFQHKEKKQRNSADTIYFAQRVGYHPGQKLVYLKIWSDNNRKSKLLYWLQNILPVDVIALDDLKVQALLDVMEKEKSTFAIVGYSSALEVVCQYLDKKKRSPVKANISSAIAISETLNEYTKTTFEKYFGVPVYSRYSNVENGIIAQQVTGSGNSYLINTASYVLEILKMNEDVPAANAELGRVVVTDLYNYATPMIRYDTGDIGLLAADNNYLEKVEGRKLDLLYATDGSLVSSYIVYKNMWQYTEITQYQLVQHGAKV
jgi:phenylacetate-CoA ligase